MSSIATNLKEGACALQAHSDEPKREAEILLCAVLDVDRSHLYAYGERELSEGLRAEYAHCLARRQRGEPVAHIIGQRGFWSLLLAVNDSTLIPRPETELLVEAALERCDKPQAYVLDLGAGTGAIGLALAKERPQWQIDAVDRQAQAVELAALNASNNAVYNSHHYVSDWFSSVRASTTAPGARFDMIVSNPPYIAADDPHLQQGDLRFEPASALVAEQEGYADLFTIARQARAFLQPGGWLLLEHGWQQAERLRAELHALGYEQVQTLSDFGGNERVTLGCLSFFVTEEE